MTLRTLGPIRRFLKRFGRKPEPVAEEVKLSLVIEGVEAYVVEAVPTGAVRFCAPGHPWNPTEENVLVCNLETFVSLAASPDSQRLVAMMVVESLRALRVKKQAEERRARRNLKRAVHAG